MIRQYPRLKYIYVNTQNNMRKARVRERENESETVERAFVIFLGPPVSIYISHYGYGKNADCYG